MAILNLVVPRGTFSTQIYWLYLNIVINNILVTQNTTESLAFFL